MKKLVEELYAEGLRTDSGHKVTISIMHRLLNNPFYYGVIRWNGEIFPGKHEPIVSKDIFDTVQEILRGKGVPKYRRHIYPFKGLIRCAQCGGKITWEKHKGHLYGHCNHQYTQCPSRQWHRQQDIEKKVMTVLTDFQIKNKRLETWIRKALKENHKDEIAYYEASVKELNDAASKITMKLDRLYDDKLDELITADVYKKKSKELEAEREKIRHQLSRQDNQQFKYLEMGVKIYELSQRSADTYKKASDEEKRELLNLLFSEMWLDNSCLFSSL